jgi:hypothetical protein
MNVQHPNDQPSGLIPPFVGSLLRSVNNLCLTVEIATEALKDCTQATADLSRMALAIQADRLRAELTTARPILT